MDSYLINFSIIYPLVITFSYLFYGLLSNDIFGIYVAFINIIFGIIGNHYIKKFFQFILPNWKLFLRPKIPKFGCGLFPIKDLFYSNNYGFPSGHAQVSVMSAVFIIYYILNQTYTIYRIILMMMIIILTMLVCYSRIYIGCHNIIQIYVGSLLGLIMGIFFYELYRKWFLGKEIKIRDDNKKILSVGFILITIFILFVKMIV